MPNYKYHCIFCNVDETIDKKMTEYNPDEPCQICNKPMKRKVENMVCGASIDKTGGFYRTTN